LLNNQATGRDLPNRAPVRFWFTIEEASQTLAEALIYCA